VIQPTKGAAVRFWKRGDDARLESDLRALRAEPDDEFVRGLSSELRPHRRPLRTAPARLALVGALTTALLVALASVGGLGYAANAAKQAAKLMKAAVASSNGGGNAVAVRGLSAGADQYAEGQTFFGDPQFTEPGAPELEGTGGAFQPVEQARRVQARFNAAMVDTSFSINEQASLRISVRGPDGKKLTITQNKSRLGDGLSGPQTKTLRYAVYIPRTIRMGLRIPLNLVQAGVRYQIVIEATDPDGNVSELTIPFVLPPL
jgi:hypothetical protein